MCNRLQILRHNHFLMFLHDWNIQHWKHFILSCFQFLEQHLTIFDTSVSVYIFIKVRHTLYNKFHFWNWMCSCRIHFWTWQFGTMEVTSHHVCPVIQPRSQSWHSTGRQMLLVKMTNTSYWPAKILLIYSMNSASLYALVSIIKLQLTIL